MKTKLRGFLIMHLVIFSTYNLGHPVTPQFINEINGPNYTSGILLAMMALAQFTFAPLWGNISDVLGRKIAFLAPLGYAFGQLGFILFTDIKYLLIFRFIAGAFSCASSAIHYAYISDQVKDQKQGRRYLIIATMMLPLATFIGFALGGQIGNLIGARNTFIIQSSISILNAIILFIVMEGHIVVKNQFKKIKWNVYHENLLLLKKYQATNLKYILILTFINITAYTLISSQANVILNEGFNKSMGYIGNFIALLNLVGAILCFIIQRQLFKKYQLSQILNISSIILVASSIMSCLTIYYGPTMMWIGLLIATIFNNI
ncbi:MAG: MFS transporter, partial [Bacilli bacterium]